MPSTMTSYCFDIDGTICTNTHGDYEKAVPFRAVIEKINRLYEGGHRVLFFTARGGTTGIDWHERTRRQLDAWGVKYHRIIMGKPEADLYIDDKTVPPEVFFSDSWIETEVV